MLGTGALQGNQAEEEVMVLCGMTISYWSSHAEPASGLSREVE